ncbi:hypothetical protein CPB86DRAFT_533574 [Serendipita vermifera]|nr:hypothetical protein CPB86DRAFT_533574 [Serendipita vermifera]
MNYDGLLRAKSGTNNHCIWDHLCSIYTKCSTYVFLYSWYPFPPFQTLFRFLLDTLRMREQLRWLEYVLLSIICPVTAGIAQNTTPNETITPTPISPLVFSMPSTVTLCTNITIEWSGGVPSWVFSWQLSKGAIGDESALSDSLKSRIFNDNSTPVLFYWYPLTAEDGDVVRFMLGDNMGAGQYIYAWSTILGNMTTCDENSGGPGGGQHGGQHPSVEIDISTTTTKGAINGLDRPISITNSASVSLPGAATPGPTPGPPTATGTSNTDRQPTASVVSDDNSMQDSSAGSNIYDNSGDVAYEGSVILSTGQGGHTYTLRSQTEQTPVS